MDVKVFRTFLELAKVRHFGRAAENLYLTQAAVSARIKQLENHFDAQLFTRDRNNIKLTQQASVWWGMLRSWLQRCSRRNLNYHLKVVRLCSSH